VWAGLGFAVDGGSTWVSGAEYKLGSEGRRICGWRLSGASTSAIDGLPVSEAKAGPPVAQSHPNGVAALDHIVVFTPDHQRTIAAIEAAGLDLRRTRDADTYEVPMRQGFFKLGPVILEVIGPLDPPASTASPSPWPTSTPPPPTSATASAPPRTPSSPAAASPPSTSPPARPWRSPSCRPGPPPPDASSCV
jgi:hypothetical protein